jgi:hypothetical protein
MIKTTMKKQDVTISPTSSPASAETSTSVLPGLAVTARECYAVTVTQTNDNHHYHQSAGPVFMAMMETIARLEAKIDELSRVVALTEKKHKKNKHAPKPAPGL